MKRKFALVKKECRLCDNSEDLHYHYHIDYPNNKEMAVVFEPGMKKKYGPYKKKEGGGSNG